ncbi:MAG: alpha amylase C-terminal domain-containing protein [Clostridia bacterium]|nr:alpha amylase C-terminal domain-containing protein [Clostridia bacterium]
MYKLLELNPKLMPYKCDIDDRLKLLKQTKKRILPKGGKLSDFANAYLYFGFHHVKGGWVYREWAPGADQLYLMGDFNHWDKTSHPMTALENGNWEIFLKGDDALWEGCKVKVVVDSKLGRSERLPLYTRYATQNTKNFVWTAEIIDDSKPFTWTDKDFVPEDKLFIYEAHIGMAQEEGKVGTYCEFTEEILPRIKAAGYNTIQLMAIMEHPYYASFGYQVSNFYAVSSWFGKPDDLKRLINKAHRLGIRVLLDVVHSHAVKNHSEGINMFDGTVYQFFHDGMRGEHPAWGTKCFNYNNPGVIHFLLSNLKFWMEEYHFDGFRFDGITSMLYKDHGLGVHFMSEAQYFSDNTDVDAIIYLQLANELIREINPKAITIAEDMSGMPGMCMPIREGGMGFDYRLAMGIADMWIKTVSKDHIEDWQIKDIWREMCLRREAEKTVAYVESHDQALVGDQTMIFRLAKDHIYEDMDKACHNPIIDKAIAVHKMARLFTISAGGEAYLNFMGNEFGHPEWIDFPREGNNWSFEYCRRQWSLQENPFLKYMGLGEFDRDMLKVIGTSDIFKEFLPQLLVMNEEKKSIVYMRDDLIFAFNFHPENDYEAHLPMLEKADFALILSSDDEKYDGYGRMKNPEKEVQIFSSEDYLDLTIPSFTALVLKKVETE